MDRIELEERLIDFAVMTIKISDALPKTRAGGKLAGQIVRSGTSPALNYGEAQSAESPNDFIHKLQVVLKELRETNIAIRIIKKAGLLKTHDKINEAHKENDELVRIFVKTITTLKEKKTKR